MERLLDVVQQLSQARDLATIAAIVRIAARDLTGADGATFVLRDNEQCYYLEENATAPLWKGKRFPMDVCISGWVMRRGESVVIEDIYADPRIPYEAYLPTFVKSLAMVPIRQDAPLGAIGNYWAQRYEPSQEEIAILQALADTTSVAMENARLYTDLQNNIETLRQRERRIKEQRDALEIFTRALAHDLKEPMRTISAYSDLIEQQAPLTGKSQDYFQHVKNASDRMLMLIDTVFQYTQLDDIELAVRQPVNLSQVVAEVQENLAILIHHSQAKILVGALPCVQANPAQMMQLFQNLIANAIHHGPLGVQIDISAHKEKNKWVFLVCDNGPGIDIDYAERIFQPFKRLSQNESGAGLGLAICRKIVELHGGSIQCESRPGAGATFFFDFPDTLPKEESMPVALKPIKQYDENLASILLVDDRKSDLELTQIMLVDCLKMQCNLFLATGGKEALEVMKQENARKRPVSLVLLDINMPGLDGFETIEIMRRDENLKDTTVIMCTGSTYQKDIDRAAALNTAGYLVKPVRIQTLKEAIEKLPVLDLQPTEDGYIVYRAIANTPWRRSG